MGAEQEEGGVGGWVGALTLAPSPSMTAADGSPEMSRKAVAVTVKIPGDPPLTLKGFARASPPLSRPL